MGLDALGALNHHRGIPFPFSGSDLCIVVTVRTFSCFFFHFHIFLEFLPRSLFEYEDFGYLWVSGRFVVISVDFMHARCLSLCISVP